MNHDADARMNGPAESRGPGPRGDRRSGGCVMLLIDGDNISANVIEQAVAWMQRRFGALHVRRAYGTAEAVVRLQADYKRLSIRPMVNLSAGKNSTDIALAADAMDLAITQRPTVMAICSSDSDFAPLVQRLREKGCKVVGLGQAGKTGEDTRALYDEFEMLSHMSGGSRPAPAVRVGDAIQAPAAASVTDRPAAPVPAPAPARESGTAAQAAAATTSPKAPKPTRGTRDPGVTDESVAPTQPDDAVSARRGRGRSRSLAGEPVEDDTQHEQPSRGAARDEAGDEAGDEARRSPAVAPHAPAVPRERRSDPARTAVEADDVEDAEDERDAPDAPPDASDVDRVAAIVSALPELLTGEAMSLQTVASRLREQGLLSRSVPASRLLARWPQVFFLMPARQPREVRLQSTPDEDER